MDLNEYQNKAMETCMDSSKNLHYMLFNLIAEVGELMEKIEFEKGFFDVKFIEFCNVYGKIAKDIRKGERIPEQMLIPDIKEFAKEAGDVEWQLSGLCKIAGLTLEEVAKMNLAKLADRKNRNTIDGNGDNR